MNRRKPRRRSLDLKTRFSPVVAESLERRLLLFSVTNTSNSGPGSLRQAILDANASPGFDAIGVQIPAGFSHTIYLSSPLPAITDAIALDNLEITTFNSHAFDGLVLASDNSTISITAHGFRTGIVVKGNDNQIGGPPASQLHTVILYDNSVDGIRIESGTGNQLTRMSIFGSGHMSINLGANGATPNDPLDEDSGPNELQNTPVITAAVGDYSGTLLKGRLDSKPDTTYRIEVYGSNNAAGAAGEARSLLGQFNVTTDAAGTALFEQAVSFYKVSQYITATATDPAGNTSELCEPTRIAPGSTVVTNTNARGAGSLFGAIVNSQANSGPDTITFNLPRPGVHRILLSAADIFPVWSPSLLTIDATTQPGYGGTPVVELVGSAGSTGGGASAGLAFYTGNAIVIRGLAIGGFQSGIDMGESTGRIEANYIGLAADGSPLPNEVGIKAGSTTIGGTVAQARNVISANTTAGIVSVDGEGSDTVQGNYIGTNSAGNAAVPNGVGIILTGGNNTIGGTVAAARNVISGNIGTGIRLDVYTDDFTTTDQYLANYVRGNFIGVAADGVTPLGNGGDGIVADGPAAFIGGTLSGQANVIAYNGGNGVTVAIDPNEVGSGQKTSVRGNAIYGNAKLGIDLGNDGVTANDPADPDIGANTLQNFPMITAASSDGAATLVSGSFNSTPGATYTLDFYSAPAADPSGVAEGRTYLGSATITTDSASNAKFVASLPIPTPPGQVVTATATNAASATSEFSSPLWISLPGDANRDGAVDFQDLALLAQSYNTTGRTWSQGDFTGDGAVDFLDLAKLAQNYNTSLSDMPAPGAALNFQAALAAAFPPTHVTVKPKVEAALKPEPLLVAKPKPVLVAKPKSSVIRKPLTSLAPRLPAPKAAVAPSSASSVFGAKPIKRFKASGEILN
jgi:hypothetical protein